MSKDLDICPKCGGPTTHSCGMVCIDFCPKCNGLGSRPALEMELRDAGSLAEINKLSDPPRPALEGDAIRAAVMREIDAAMNSAIPEPWDVRDNATDRIMLLFADAIAPPHPALEGDELKVEQRLRWHIENAAYISGDNPLLIKTLEDALSRITSLSAQLAEARGSRPALDFIEGDTVSKAQYGAAVELINSLSTQLEAKEQTHTALCRDNNELSIKLNALSAQLAEARKALRKIDVEGGVAGEIARRALAADKPVGG